jgi:hypothetical protein
MVSNMPFRQEAVQCRLRPADPEALAAAVAGAVVTSVDKGAQAANIWYWHKAEPLFAAVRDRIAACPDERIRRAADHLLRAPADLAAYRRLHGLVIDALHDRPGSVAPVVDAAWTVLTRSRLAHYVGSDYRPGATLGLAALAVPPPPTEAPDHPARADDDPDLLVVVPFQDRSEDGHRARNLLACLTALRDQTLARARYRVTVVESDSTPRWRDSMAQYADKYLFAKKAGPFNKCWTVNVGVQNSSGHAALICMLDADALVDADFLARNVSRFRRPGTGAVLPYRDLFYLDSSASARAIEERCMERLPRVDWTVLRGFLVHRAQGVCVWLRRDVFDDIGGLDERHEGWGKEDMDLLLRLQLATALLHFDDPMLHLHHPPSYRLDGNAHIPWLSWVPDTPIGRLDRFAGVSDA